MTELCINGVDWQVIGKSGGVAIKNTTGLSVLLPGPVAELLGTAIQKEAVTAIHDQMSGVLIATDMGLLYPPGR